MSVSSTPPPRAPTVHGRPRVVMLCSTGFVVRNYLMGGFLPRLREEADLTAISPLASDPLFVGRMEAAGVEVVPPSEHPPAGVERLRMVRNLLHVADLDTETWRLKMFDPEHHDETPGQRRKKRLVYAGARWLACRRSVRWIDRAEAERTLRSRSARHYAELFRRARPALVFSPAPLFPEEWVPVYVARSMGIPVALSILSWDNLSSKSRIPVPADVYLVWGQLMEQELLDYYPDVDRARVHVTGAPQFDFHRDDEYHESREPFLLRVGLDPARPVVLYGGVTPSLMPHEEHIVGRLIEDMRDRWPSGGPQLLVRLHPKDDGARYRRFRERHPEVVFSVPGEASGGALRSWQPDRDEIRTLSNVLRHADVHINVCSTMTIDAAIVDRPVINVRYDLRPEGARPSWGIRGYEYTHYQPILESGGVRQAHSPDQLIDQVDAYLRAPSLDAEGRRRIVELECGRVDGRAGERAAEVLLETVGAAASGGRS